ncbi:hypothetical protein IC617_14040 [Neiella sp. HB171785]|uniref:Uncharacterized protein n=1 Tax=Neiella litorisoli TaxID=2771431 RepID=A0A8J6UF51_9GAMM|nr:hypothetical protein [Neiella litorisoli]MBD1390554.1 hypothetical protein [Neiella litorisoli]
MAGQATWRFLKYWLATFVLLLAGLMLTNLWLDPLYLYHYENVPRSASGFEREFKPWHYKQLKDPEYVIIGNSRTDYGLDLGHLGEVKGYNFSVPGAGMTELRRMFEHVVDNSQPSTVFLVVENFCDGGVARKPVHLSGHILQDLRSWFYRINYLISSQTLRDGLGALGKKQSAYYDRYGRRLAFMYINDTVSERMERREAARVKINERAAESRRPSTALCRTSSLQQIINTSYDQGIDLKLIINPMHLRYLEIDHQFMLAERKLTELKVHLVKAVADVADRRSLEPVPIFDFQLVNSYTTEYFDYETVEDLRYWSESSHYTKAMGDLMLDWIYASEPQRDAAFAALLTPDTVELHVEKQWQLFLDWRTTNPRVVEEIAEKYQTPYMSRLALAPSGAK